MLNLCSTMATKLKAQPRYIILIFFDLIYQAEIPIAIASPNLDRSMGTHGSKSLLYPTMA